MITNSQASAIASMLAGRFKVKIVAREDGGWCFNSKDNTIYYDPNDLNRLSEDDVIANLIHEVGHAKYSQDYETLLWPDSVKQAHIPKLHKLFNAIEDFRIEDILREDYPYASLYLPEYSFKTYFTLQQLEQRCLSEKKPMPPYLQYVVAIYGFIASVQMLFPLPKVRVKVVATKMRAWNLRFTKSSQELADGIAKDLYPHIKDLLDDYEDVVPPHILTMAATKRGHEGGGDEHKTVHQAYEKYYDSIKKLIPSTVTIFNRMLTDQKFDKYAGNHRSGRKLDAKSLYKFKLDDFKLFQRKEAAKSRDYVFSLVVDESGSMQDGSDEDYDVKENKSKMAIAVRSAVLFANVLEKLSIPYSIHGFNSKMHTYKTAHEGFSTRTKKGFEEMFSQAWTDDAGYNNDGQAVNTFAKPMLQFSGRKIMIVLSDGYPAENPNGRGFNLTQELMKAEKKGIEPIGIGIKSGAVKAYYKNVIVVDDLDELPKAMMGKIKSKLKAHV